MCVCVLFLSITLKSIISSGLDQSVHKTMPEKLVTTMVIKVDLGCAKCHKKMKKVLCKIPEIQNQIYDKKANTVTITVVCCSPEKIKKKICCKGGETIKNIEIKVPKPNPAPTPPARSPKPDPVAAPPAAKPVPRTCCSECRQGLAGGPCYHGYYGWPVYDSWGGGSCGCGSRGYYVCRCEYVCENNPSFCTIT